MCASTASHADEGKIPQSPFQVRVVDADSSPIAGVSVRAFGLRMKIGRGSWFRWIPKRHGPVSAAITDQDGIARLLHPDRTAGENATGEVDCIFDHADYVVRRADVRVDNAAFQVRLERGVRIAVTARHASDESPIPRDLHGLLCGRQFGDQWKLFGNGTLMSRTVARRRNRLRLVHLPDGGQTLWSKLLKPSIRRNSSRVMLRDVALSSGTQVAGRLDKAVPRPVRNGSVIAIATQHTGMRDSERIMEWAAWEPVNPDGTFDFHSLPPDGFVQIFAYCDGWSSANPGAADLEKVGLAEFRGDLRQQQQLPQVFRLSGVQRTCVLPVLPSAGCRIRVVNASGRPVAGATVSTWPNQCWMSGGCEVAGDGLSTARLLKLQQRELLQPMWEQSAGNHDRLTQLGVKVSRRQEYTGVTDVDGRLLISNLPVARAGIPSSFAFTAVAPGKTATVNSPQTRILLLPGETGDLTIPLAK